MAALRVSSSGLTWWLCSTALSGPEAPFYFSALSFLLCDLMDQDGCFSSSYYICSPANREEDSSFKDTSWIVLLPLLLTSHCPKLSHMATPRCKGDLGWSRVPTGRAEALRKEVSGSTGGQLVASTTKLYNKFTIISLSCLKPFNGFQILLG